MSVPAVLDSSTIFARNRPCKCGEDACMEDTKGAWRAITSIPRIGTKPRRLTERPPETELPPHFPIRTEIRCPLYIKSTLIPPLRRGPFTHQINAKSRYIRRRINCRLGGGAGIIMRISVLLEG